MLFIAQFIVQGWLSSVLTSSDFLVIAFLLDYCFMGMWITVEANFKMEKI